MTKNVLIIIGIIAVVLVGIYCLSPGIRLELRGYDKVYAAESVDVYYDNEDICMTAFETIITPTGREFEFSCIRSVHYKVVKGLSTYELVDAIDLGYLSDTELEELFLLGIPNSD
jgi:hypothetical protein